MQDIAAAIDAAGAAHISFNPITKPNIEKALKSIVGQTGLQLGAEVLTSISEGANGDLRSAVETLQLAAAGVPFNAKASHKGKVSCMSLPDSISGVCSGVPCCAVLCLLMNSMTPETESGFCVPYLVSAK